MSPAPAPTPPCNHLGKLVSTTANVVHAGALGWTADISITCSCGKKFRFKGLPAGSLRDQPTTSYDQTELRAPLEIDGEPDLAQQMRYEMRPGPPMAGS